MGYSKPIVEKILVASGNVALPAAGTDFVNLATGVVNLANGQLGIFDVRTKKALGAGATAVDTPEGIFIAQGTSHSAAPGSGAVGALPSQPFRSSQPILNNGLVLYKGNAYEADWHDVWVVGTADGSSGEINISDETTYALTIALEGARVDIINGVPGAAVFPEFTTPDYTSSSVYTSEVLRRDHLVQNLCYETNKLSRIWPQNVMGSQFVAFAVDRAGTGAGTAISGLSAGAFTVATTSGGSTVSLTLTTAMVNSLKRILVANGGTVENTAEIVGIVLSTAGTSTAVASCDTIVLMSLDEATVNFDRHPSRKVNLIPGLRSGFNTSTVSKTNPVKAKEALGGGRNVQIFFDSTDGLREAYNEQYPDANVITYTSPITTSATYDCYVIESGRYDEVSGAMAASRFATYIFNPTGDTTTKASLQAVLNPWMQSLANAQAVISL